MLILEARKLTTIKLKKLNLAEPQGKDLKRAIMYRFKDFKEDMNKGLNEDYEDKELNEMKKFFKK